MSRRPFIVVVALASANVAANVVPSSAGPPPAGPAHARGASSVAPVAATSPRAAEIEALAREAIRAGRPRLPKGATIVAVRATAAVPIPPGASRAEIDVTPPPRRAGPVTTTAVLRIEKDDAVAARVPLAIDLDVPPEALVWDVPKGTPIVLVVRRQLVEVSAPAVAGADGDVGDVIHVLLRPSGRVVRATLVAKDRAVATERQ